MIFSSISKTQHNLFKTLKHFFLKFVNVSKVSVYTLNFVITRTHQRTNHPRLVPKATREQAANPNKVRGGNGGSDKWVQRRRDKRGTGLQRCQGIGHAISKYHREVLLQ